MTKEANLAVAVTPRLICQIQLQCFREKEKRSEIQEYHISPSQVSSSDPCPLDCSIYQFYMHISSSYMLNVSTLI
jgi:hypothetical protein